jgi:3-oxoadipate enol-lactonase
MDLTNATGVDTPVLKARVNGITVAYRAWGPPDAPAMVLLHSMRSDGLSWSEVAAHYQDSWRIYAPDLRGHGKSDWPGTYSVELMRDDVLALLDHLGVDRAVVAGHSAGSMVAYHLAWTAPERVTRLVLEDPLPPIPAGFELPEKTEEALSWPIDWACGEALYEDFNHPDPGWLARLGDITAPTLVIGGGEVSYIPQEPVADLAARIPRGRLVTINVGHQVHDNALPAYLAAFDAFLAETEPRSRLPHGMR